MSHKCHLTDIESLSILKVSAWAESLSIFLNGSIDYHSKEDEIMVVGIVGLIIWIVCLIANIKIAKAKNRRVAVWVILSVFFSWITLIVNAVLPAKQA